MPLRRVHRAIQAERHRGRAFQPRYGHRHVVASWLGGLLAISALALLSDWSGYALVVAPFGASSVLLFGASQSPLAQPRNLVLGNSLAALLAVICVHLAGRGPWSMGMAVGLAIAAGQLLRCLHPPAGAIALLGVLLATLFDRLIPETGRVSHHGLQEPRHG